MKNKNLIALIIIVLLMTISLFPHLKNSDFTFKSPGIEFSIKTSEPNAQSGQR